MARIKSAIKNIRKTERRNAINRASRSGLRTQIKKIREMIDKKDVKGAQGALSRTLSTIARAQKKGLVHRNAAARQKSRLTRHVNDISGSR